MTSAQIAVLVCSAFLLVLVTVILGYRFAVRRHELSVQYREAWEEREREKERAWERYYRERDYADLRRKDPRDMGNQWPDTPPPYPTHPHEWD